MFEDLLKRAKAGEREAAGHLLEPYLPALTAFVRLRLESPLKRRESTGDIVQSVCREVLTHIDQVQANDEVGFRAWLFGVVRNKLSHRRAYHRAAKRDFAAEAGTTPGQGASTDELILQVYSNTVTPSQDAAASEEVARIESAFDALPPDYRKVLLRVSIAGLTYAQAAEDLDRSEDAVRQLLHRARARLATLLD